MPLAPVPLSRITFRLLTIEAIEQSETGKVIVSVEMKSVSFILDFELFAYFLETLLILSYLSSLSCFVRKMSIKRLETVVMNLHVIGNTFVNIRKNSHTLHFHHSDWFQIVRDCWIYLYRKQSERIFGQVGPGLYAVSGYVWDNDRGTRHS